MHIKIFSKHNCMACRMVKKYLQDHGINFKEVNVDIYPEQAQYLKDMGHQGLPVVVADNIEFVGFRPDLLKNLVNGQ